MYAAKDQPAGDKEYAAYNAQAAKILAGEAQMTYEISAWWGKKAHEQTNLVRETRGLKPLDWSNQMHTVAYQRCLEVVRGIIPFKQSNLLNVISETRSFYEPDYQIGSLSEQSEKLRHVKAGQDYIKDWVDAWNIDHYYEAAGDWSHEATAVYFDAETKTVLFTELLAMISEIPTHSFRI